MFDFRCLLVISNLVVHSSCLRILGIFPYSGRSHYYVFETLFKALAIKGHSVTALSHYPQEYPVKNLEDISMAGSTQRLFETINLDAIRGSRSELYFEPVALSIMAKETCEKGLPSPAVQGLINSNRTFDLILIEFFTTDCFIGFAHKFHAPVIGLSSSALLSWTYQRFGLLGNPSYLPSIFMDFNNRMNFLERLENTVMKVCAELSFQFLVHKPDDEIARKYFGDDLPPLSVVIENYTSLVLVNTHFSLHSPFPIPPAVVEIGGVALSNPKRLPLNLEKWINESTHGVIYFSLGSMIKGHTFPEEKRQIFLRAFGRLPQRVLWKWENDTMPGKPENVMIQKWMPQFDILCHPNVKAFISHGGLLGTTEAVHCGVPAIVMPQYGDQHTNARAWEANGGAVILRLHEITDENLQEALNKILNPNFKKQAEDLSARFRDRPMSPLDTAIYWVEYVARHKGARHMRTAAVGMPLYKYLLLDVVAFLLAILSVIIWISYYITKRIFRAIFRRNKKVKTN